MEWLRKFRLKQHKKKVLTEIRGDINYIYKFKSDILNYNVDKDRDILAQQNVKPDGKKDKGLVKDISAKITERNTVVAELEELEKMEGNMIKYVSLL